MMNECRMSQVKQYIRENHFKAHGLHKGSASYASSGTTCAPSIPSICNRGEWSMGKVLDVYWHFCNEGDHYLGRVLCGLDPNTDGFSSLPPHFIVSGNLLEDDDIRTAMEIMYGPIMQTYKNQPELDPTGLLLLLLASVVHHSDWLLGEICSRPDHPFALLPVLQKLCFMRE